MNFVFVIYVWVMYEGINQFCGSFSVFLNEFSDGPFIALVHFHSIWLTLK